MSVAVQAGNEEAGTGWRRNGLSDLIAGIITATLLVPQAIAFASLAGLPAQAGLYASVVPVFAYALLGTSGTLAVGPVSVASLMVAQALARPGLTADPLANAAALALMGGMFMLALALVRAGALVKVLSAPVLAGFTSGAAILIMASQFRELTAMPLVTTPQALMTMLEVQGALIARTAFVGLASLLMMLFLGPAIIALARRTGLYRGWITIATRAMPLGVVLAAAAAVAWYDVTAPGHGVRVVGDVPAGLPSLSLDFLSTADWVALWPSAVMIALVGYVESVAIAKAFAAQRGETIDANRELVALGVANVGASVTGALPVAGGFGRTVVNAAAGARTQWAAVVSGVLVIAILLADPVIIERIPRAALAAIIMAAVVKLIDVHGFAGMWRSARGDALVFLITAIGVLVAGVEPGLILGLVASGLVHVCRMSRSSAALRGMAMARLFRLCSLWDRSHRPVPGQQSK